MAGTLVANTINTDTGLFTTNNAYLGIAKAWVNFNGGTGGTAGTINNSFNVSSVTVNATGKYTLNFTTAMPNANYAWSGGAYNSGGTGFGLLYLNNAISAAPTTTTFSFCIGSENSPYSTAATAVTIFGS